MLENAQTPQRRVHALLGAGSSLARLLRTFYRKAFAAPKLLQHNATFLFAMDIVKNRYDSAAIANEPKKDMTFTKHTLRRRSILECIPFSCSRRGVCAQDWRNTQHGICN
jgi:hypothetical protein